MENWRVKIVDVGYKVSKEIFIFRRLPNGKTEILQEGGVITSDYGVAPKPTIELYPEMLQELANELSNSGFKPKEGYMEGKLLATEKHLEDMRKIVFKKSN